MTELLLSLEAQAVEKIRDAFDNEHHVAVLISDGVASDVLRHIFQKALFPFQKPYTIVHLDEGANFAELANFVDRIREQENQKIEVRRLKTAAEEQTVFQKGPTALDLNCGLRDLVADGGYDVVITGLQWNREHPWLSHDLVFRSNQIQRVEPLGNWTRRDLENYAIENIQGYLRPKVRVS